MKPLSKNAIKESFPTNGLFNNKEWLFSPLPFHLPASVLMELNEIGILLNHFIECCNEMYLIASAHSELKWVHDLLNLGKPQNIIKAGLSPNVYNQIPTIIRPDILITESGLQISEIDSTPGGIGLTAWLNDVYALHGWPVIGGRSGMTSGFKNILNNGRVIFSKEAQDYRPEIEWIVEKIDAQWQEKELIINEWDFIPERHHSRNFYRYFELWDQENIQNFEVFAELSSSGESTFNAPMKAFLEEKIHLALIWNTSLREHWKTLLGCGNYERLKSIIPRGWILDPTPIPHTSVYPGLEINDWSDLAKFSQKNRKLVLKISGFSPHAWGSRGVYFGHDLSASDWSKYLKHSLRSFNHNPYILQNFAESCIVNHPYYDPACSDIRIMEGRVRLCPYYFTSQGDTKLAGVLATICPKDKKAIHGMRDSILVPCV